MNNHLKVLFHFINHRCGVCGAWSYSIRDATCYLHTADACCSQKNKQQVDSNFVSGFFCTKCWTTKADCGSFCPLSKRLEGQIGCSIKQSNAAKGPQYQTPTVSTTRTLAITALEL